MSRRAGPLLGLRKHSILRAKGQFESKRSAPAGDMNHCRRHGRNKSKSPIAVRLIQRASKDSLLVLRVEREDSDHRDVRRAWRRLTRLRGLL